MASRALTSAAILVLLCASCSADSENNGKPTTSQARDGASATTSAIPIDPATTGMSAPDPDDSSAPPAPISPMVNPDFFGPDEWSVHIPGESTVIVWADRVLYLEEDTVTAIGSDGSAAWTAKTHVNDGQPVLAEKGDVQFRAISRNAIAVLRDDSELTSIDSPEPGARITVIGIADGETTGPVEVVGAVGRIGLAFGPLAGWSTPRSSSPTETITPAGELATHDPESLEIVGMEVHSVPAMLVGDVLVDGLQEPPSGGLRSDHFIGFAADGWTSVDLAPDGYDPTMAEPQATDGDRILAVEWWHSGAGPRYTLIDVTEGRTVAAVPCGGFKRGTGDDGVLSTSPDGRFLVHGRLILNLETGTHRCVDLGGGGSPEFHTVGDLGWAYTWAADSDGNRVMVASNLDGDDVVSHADERVQLPIGMLDNGLAVHYDKDSGLLSANPVLP